MGKQLDITVYKIQSNSPQPLALCPWCPDYTLRVFGIPKHLYQLHCPNFQILWLPRKSQPGTEKSNPPISSKWWYIMVGFLHLWIQNTWKWGGRPLLNPKKKTTIGSKCPCNPKTPNLQSPPNPTLLGNNNPTNSFKTLENWGVGHFKTFNTYHN
jgi:hypothetical protein